MLSFYMIPTLSGFRTSHSQVRIPSGRSLGEIRTQVRGRSHRGTPVHAGQTGRQPAETPVFSVAGLRAEGGIGDPALGPANKLPLP